MNPTAGWTNINILLCNQGVQKYKIHTCVIKGNKSNGCTVQPLDFIVQPSAFHFLIKDLTKRNNFISSLPLALRSTAECFAANQCG